MGGDEGASQYLYLLSTFADDVAIPAEWGMTMEKTMTQGLRYLSFRLTIKELMLRAFSSIWIVRAVVFLLQHKSWRDECKLVARDPTEDIRVGIRRVSWIL